MRLLAVVMALHAAPLAAQVLPLPPHCEGVVTVQMSFCTVANIWNCEVDGQREVWTYNYGPAANIVFQRDTDGQQIAAFQVTDGGTSQTVPVTTVTDPVSIAALSAGEVDRFDMVTRRADGVLWRNTGTYQVMGPARDVDGWSLVPVLSETFADDGSAQSFYHLMDAGRGILFHTGFAEAGALDQPFPEIFLPVDVAFPGDDGFLASEPAFGCED